MTHRIDLKVVFTIFFIVLSVLLFRRYDAFVNPQLYAEDGAIFLQQFENSGISSLWQPYAGYLHTIQRLVAAAGGILHIDMLSIPFYYNFAAFTIAFLLALYLYYCASLINLQQKILFATSFLFIPVDSEIYMNLTNSIWLVELGLIAYVFIHHKHSATKGVPYFLSLLIVFLLSLTGPCAFIISPVILFIIIKDRKQLTVAQLVPLLIILSGGAVQAYCIKFSGTNSVRNNFDIPAEEWHLLKLFTYNTRDLLFLNSEYLHWSENTRNTIAAILAVLIILVAIYAYRKINVSRKYVPALAGLLFFISFVFSFWPYETLVLALRSARYYFIPFSCFALLMIIAADKKITTVHLAAYIAFFSLHVEMIRFSLPDKNWKQEILLYNNSVRSNLPINPDGWYVQLPSKPEPIDLIDYNDVSADLHFGDKEKEIAFWGNSSIATQPLTLSPGKYEVRVIIIGYPVDGVSTHHNIYVNDRKVGDFYTIREYRDYSIPFTIETTTTATIKMDMDNDAFNDHEDRNAFMKAMIVLRVP